MKHASSDLSLIYSAIQERTGLRLSDTQKQDLERLLLNPQFLPDKTNLTELPMLLLEQPTDSTVWQSLIRTVTVGETYFFRNQAQFEALRLKILPDLIKKRRQNGQLHLRFWSAGCATGEEPYSLAMLLRDLIPDVNAWQITILATDVNEYSIARAQRGAYRAWSFRNETPHEIQAQWFSRHGESFQISPVIQRMVYFKHLNLISDHYPSFDSNTMNMDLILCRNVTIYFDQETTKSIAERFHKTLVPDGWLVVGHSEPMASIYKGFSTRNFPNTVLYQKSTSENPESAQPDLTTTPPLYSPSQYETKPLNLSALDTKPLSSVNPTKNVSYVVMPIAEVLAETPDTFYLKAKASADIEDWPQTLLYLTQAEFEDKFFAPVYLLRAIVQWHLGDVDGALNSLRHAIYCMPRFAMAHFTLAEIYKSRNENALARRHWKLADQALSGLTLDQQVPFADDLTVEMLKGLLAQRLEQ
jgi:chemotaxis protein methyltransferase CheR